jgi:DNA-binding MarR family transcriptional regulator
VCTPAYAEELRRRYKVDRNRESGGCGKPMTLQQLKYLIEIVNCGSINKAAERLYTAQPSLSNALHDLESEMGLDLIARTPKGISMTVDGSEFLGCARQVVEQMGLLEQRWLNKKPSRKVLSVSMQHYAFAINTFVNMVKKQMRTNMNTPCGKHGRLKLLRM